MAEYVGHLGSGLVCFCARHKGGMSLYCSVLFIHHTDKCYMFSCAVLLASLLACNQELVQAFTAYNQMMERQHLNKATKASETTDSVQNRNGNGLPHGQHVPTDDLLSFGDTVGSGGNGAGVGNGHTYSNGHGASNGKSAVHNVPVTQNVSQDPFGDDPYYVGSQSDVSAAVKNGYVCELCSCCYFSNVFFFVQAKEECLHTDVVSPLSFFFLSSCYVVSGRTIRTKCLMRRRISDNSRSSRNSCRRLRSSRGNCTLSNSSCRTAVDQVKPHLVLFLSQLFPKHTTTNQFFHPSTAKKKIFLSNVIPAYSFWDKQSK